jgi:hypothetical protein
MTKSVNDSNALSISSPAGRISFSGRRKACVPRSRSSAEKLQVTPFE